MKRVLDFVKKDLYVKGYNAYLEVSDQREANIACLQHHIPRALKQIQLPKNKSKFNILSVGAGNGKMDHEILKTVQKGYLDADKQMQDEVKILNTALEPHPKMIELYKEFISKLPKEEGAVVEFDLKPITFDEYAKSKHEPNQYDMVHAIYSLYYVDNLESALDHCYYNELGETGLIACFMVNSQFIMYQIAEIIDKREENGAFSTTSAEIVRAAEKNAWKFEIVYCSILIDVTEIFRHNSDEGNLLLDFLSFTPAFRQSKDQEIVASVLELLEKRANLDKDGRLVVKDACDLILIYKL